MVKAKKRPFELFEAFDEDKSGTLGREEILRMLRALVVVGIENLLKLGVGNTDVGFTTQENIDAYQNSLVRNLDTALDKVVDDVIGFEN